MENTEGTRTLYTGDGTTNVLDALLKSSVGMPEITFLKWPHHAWIPKTAEEKEVVLAAIEAFNISQIIFSVRPVVDIKGQNVETVREFFKTHLPDRQLDFLVTRKEFLCMVNKLPHQSTKRVLRANATVLPRTSFALRLNPRFRENFVQFTEHKSLLARPRVMLRAIGP